MTSALTAEKIVTAWETGTGLAPLDRALVMIWAADGGDGADLPLAERDRQLLALRRATFGSALSAVAECPGCGTRVELTLDAEVIADLLVTPGSELIETPEGSVALRPLTSRDLAVAVGLAEDQIADVLRDRVAEGDGALSDTACALVDAAIEKREAAGEIAVALRCADCASEWQEPLDVSAHVWSEVEAAALRILGEVAEIAAAFGWAEAEILAMSPRRRAAYLQLTRRE